MNTAVYDITGAIIEYESGGLEHEEFIELFQHLVDNGMAFTLQGSYGRTAHDLIKAGLVIPVDKRAKG